MKINSIAITIIIIFALTSLVQFLENRILRERLQSANITSLSVIWNKGELKNISVIAPSITKGRQAVIGGITSMAINETNMDGIGLQYISTEVTTCQLLQDGKVIKSFQLKPGDQLRYVWNDNENL